MSNRFYKKMLKDITNFSSKFTIHDKNGILSAMGKMDGTVFSGDPLSTTLGNTKRVIAYVSYRLD